MFSFLSLIWFLRTTKSILFWVYLWQLKEYHIGRFLDHFRTEKGKGLLINKILAIKIFLFAAYFVLPVFVFFAVTIFYMFEAVKLFFDLLGRRLRKPVLTKKTALLISTGILAELLIIFFLTGSTLDIKAFALWLLAFDILAPLIVSMIVLAFQPLAVLARNRIINRAKEKRSKFKDLLVIGITGSFGKTSTKEFLAAILSKKFRVLKTKEHQNSEVGISQCILQELKPEHEIFIVEMGAYNRGGIKLLCDIAKPKIGVLTGINEQHMATFGSQENIVKGKYELIESLPEDGVAFFNAKNKYCLELYDRTKIKKILYGTIACDLGRENILGAMAVAKELGMTGEEIAEGIKNIKDWLPGVQIKEGINGLKIIDATYSANPDGVMANLEYLRTFSGRKIMVMPCLIELGRASREVHRRIGQKIAEICDLAIITTRDRFKEIVEGAGDKAVFLEDPKEILEKIKDFSKQGDVVLLESRVPAILIKELIRR